MNWSSLKILEITSHHLKLLPQSLWIAPAPPLLNREFRTTKEISTQRAAHLLPTMLQTSRSQSTKIRPKRLKVVDLPKLLQTTKKITNQEHHNGNKIALQQDIPSDSASTEYVRVDAYPKKKKRSASADCRLPNAYNDADSMSFANFIRGITDEKEKAHNPPE